MYYSCLELLVIQHRSSLATLCVRDCLAAPHVIVSASFSSNVRQNDFVMQERRFVLIS